MRTLSLLMIVTVLLLSCAEPAPPKIEYEITSGMRAASLAEQLTTHADISLSGRELTLKRKDGDNNWLLGNQVFIVTDGGEFHTADHHHALSFTVLLHASGDVIVSYQARHHPPGMDHPELDTGTLVIPKAFVHTR